MTLLINVFGEQATRKQRFSCADLKEKIYNQSSGLSKHESQCSVMKQFMNSATAGSCLAFRLL